MKIKSMNLINNTIFGNMDFDFCTESGDVAETIILAGENGCGKTSLLDIIYEFSNFSKIHLKNNEERNFRIILSISEFEILKKEMQLENYDYPKEISIMFSKTSKLIVKDVILVYDNKEISLSNKLIFLNNSFAKIAKIFKTIYSTTEINYFPKESKLIEAIELDNEIIKSYSSSSSDLATSIQKMFISIDANDSLEVTKWIRNNEGKVPPKSLVDIRINRFKNAFKYIFESLNYNDIKIENENRIVYFNSNDVEIPISKLSSGEKQIIFRGAFLLKDIESIKGSPILIDEPEISLHPKWQKKILGYYQNLFLNIDGVQESQIFVSTHSPFVIHGERGMKDKVIVLCKEKNIINILDNPTYPIGDEEVLIKQAFNLNLFKFDKPVIITEGSTDWKHMKAAYIKLKEMNSKLFNDFDFSFLEYEPENSNNNNCIKLQMSNKELVSMCKVFSKVHQENKKIFIADRDDLSTTKDLSDGDKLFKNWGNNVYSFVLPVPKHRKDTPDICIEHYYSDDEIKTRYTCEDGIERRIYMGNEFNTNGVSSKLQLICTNKNSCGKTKINIIDGSSKSRVNHLDASEDDGGVNFALSKMEFARNILSDKEPFNMMNFNAYVDIFNIIKKICLEK